MALILGEVRPARGEALFDKMEGCIVWLNERGVAWNSESVDGSRAIVGEFSFAFAGGTGNFRAMTPDEESSTPQESPAPGKRPRARPPRRGGRGRGRGRGRGKPGAPEVAEERPPAETAAAAVAPERELEAAAEEVFPEPEPVEADTPLPDSAIEEARREAAEASMAEPSSYREPYGEAEP